jgi:hypothetical protein
MAGMMMIEKKLGTQTEPKRSGMKAEQVETYRKAIAPFQEQFEASKAARLEAFRWIKGRIASPEIPHVLVAGSAGEPD